MYVRFRRAAEVSPDKTLDENGPSRTSDLGKAQVMGRTIAFSA
jgi:hypothetical protein